MAGVLDGMRVVEGSAYVATPLGGKNPMFRMVEQPGIGTYLMAGSPLVFGATSRIPAQRAPLLGEHTDEILAGILDMSEGQIARLHDDGVVAGPPTGEEPSR